MSHVIPTQQRGASEVFKTSLDTNSFLSSLFKVSMGVENTTGSNNIEMIQSKVLLE